MLHFFGLLMLQVPWNSLYVIYSLLLFLKNHVFVSVYTIIILYHPLLLMERCIELYGFLILTFFFFLTPFSQQRLQCLGRFQWKKSPSDIMNQKKVQSPNLQLAQLLVQKPTFSRHFLLMGISVYYILYVSCTTDKACHLFEIRGRYRSSLWCSEEDI